MGRHKIAFVGAYGYGNTGDDTYPLVLKRHLKDQELLFFNSDVPEKLPVDIDLIILGGGGIIYNNSDKPVTEPSPHFLKMTQYLDFAMENQIPYGFLSCGFQFKTDSDEEKETSLAPWAPYLGRALLATFRSPTCLKMFRDLTGRRDGSYFPDLGYLNTPTQVSRNGIHLPQKYVVIAPAGAINPADDHLAHQVRLLEASGHVPMWVQMGADRDDARYFQYLQDHHPQWPTLRGGSSEEVVSIIAGARFVISGRYHGMVFARANGVPFYVPQRAPHKIMVEDYSSFPGSAIGHIELLLEYLKDI